jgi:hypothetical protein
VACRLRSRLSSARQPQPPPSTSIIITSTSQATTTTKTPIVQPQPTTPGATRTLSSGNDYNSPPMDWRVWCTGGANGIGCITVQRGDVAYGQPGNDVDAVNTITAGSDGGTTTVTKTYDNGDVKLRNMRAPAPQATPPQAPVTPLAAQIKHLCPDNASA